MWPVSSRFLTALTAPQRRITTATYQNPGGDEVALRVKRGTIRLDDGARYRRGGELGIFGSTAEYEAVMTPGTLIRVEHGLVLGSSTIETVPVFTGEVLRGRQPLGGSAGEIRIPLVDRAVWLGRSDFVDPYSPTIGTTRIAAISEIVTDAMPGVTIVVTATDTGTIEAARVFSGSRLDAISQLTADGGMESFFQGDGTYVIRDQATLSETPAWTMRGVVISGERERAQDRLYNTVVVTPSALDGSQSWARQVVSITDPTSPRHPDKIGVVPYFLPSPTASSAEAAYRAGAARLSRVQGKTERLALDAISNPALEGGDVIRVIVPATGDAPANIYQHIVDGMTLDLVSGAMSLDTRSQEDVAP